ncbi:MAG: Coenzyme F420 hydrogenase/dehydrogenase, beta subunit C-terminal domain [Proteobacteria bacterium]|nr:Coenzyme F420 hydrogenase/dehydrogenase, beta subunit C-terminal domain [Pseudomonadota bacterium]
MKKYESLKNKTIKGIAKDGLCTGCGTCISICPHSAIELTIDAQKGIYLPYIKEKECNQCGTCVDVCPGHAVDFKSLNLSIFGQELRDNLLGNHINCYVGHATDYDIRYNSASGGLVTALLVFALEEGLIDGALVTRMKKDNPLEPEPFIARTREEIISASKSKYCPVPANIALKEILLREGKYAVVGLPCHLHGLRKAQMINSKLKQRVVLELGIFCGGGISFLGTEFWLKKIGISKEEVEKIDYRGEGWPGSMTIQLKNNKKKESHLYYYYYNRGFNCFVPWRCTLCWDRTAELADISFGDAWLSEIIKNDKIGSSIIVSRTMQGENIIEQMISRNAVKFDSINHNKVLESQRGFFWQKSDFKLRRDFLRFFNKKVPYYNNDDLLLNPILNAYLNSLIFYLRRFFVSKSGLLWALYSLNALMGLCGKIKRKVKNIIQR